MPRREYRNEVKTRLPDRTYDALQQYKALHGIDSDSAALARCVELMLLGVIGNLPSNLLDRSADQSQPGMKVAA
jgi:hypothetical protein